MPRNSLKSRAFTFPVSLALLGTIAGCASLGGNIKGNFVCRAPSGICAPTSNIDEQAIASINQQSASAFASERAGNAARSVARSSSALKILLPARHDRFGRWREASIIYIEPDVAGVMAGYSDTGVIAPRLSLSELAAGAPELTTLQTPKAAAPVVSAGDMKARVDLILSKRSGQEASKLPLAIAVSPASAATVPASAATVPASAATVPANDAAVVSAPKFSAPDVVGDF